MDGVFAVTDISKEVDEFSDLGCITRFNQDGEIDVRNGEGYANESIIDYNAGEYYHVLMKVNLSLKTYNVFVTPQSTIEKNKWICNKIINWVL